MTINIVKNLIAVSLCLCVFIWSITPTFSHTPAVLDIIQTQVAAAEHGHTHGAEEDLYWAMHGHDHDVADHDHSHGYFSVFAMPNVGFLYFDIWLMHREAGAGYQPFRIDRPPRV